MTINEILNQYGLYMVIFAGVMILTFVLTKFNNKKLKESADNYFTENPTAAKIFTSNKTGVTQEELYIINVDGNLPISFKEDGKNAIYVLPGERTLLLSYTYTRPGVMYKSVSKSTGNVEQTVTIEANKSYILGFDKKKSEFTFEEM